MLVYMYIYYIVMYLYLNFSLINRNAEKFQKFYVRFL